MTDTDYEAPQDEELYYKQQMQKNGKQQPAYPGVVQEDVSQEVVPFEYVPAMQMQDHLTQKRDGSGREVYLYIFADGQYQLYQQTFQTKSQAINFARQNLKGIRTFAGTEDEVLTFQESLWKQQQQQVQRQATVMHTVSRVEQGSQNLQQGGKRLLGNLKRGFVEPDVQNRPVFGGSPKRYRKQQVYVNPYGTLRPSEHAPYGVHQQQGFRAAPRWGPAPQRIHTVPMGMQQPRMFLSNKERSLGYGRKHRR